MTQLSFATLDHRNKKKQTKRERFLGEMSTAGTRTIIPGRAPVTEARHTTLSTQGRSKMDP